MSVLTSLGILLLVALILAFLQMVPGIFMLISHYASGKFSRRKAADQALFFVIGAEIGVIFFLLAMYAISMAVCLTSANLENGILVWMMSGILVALAILFAIYYFDKGPGTAMFISRKFAKQIRDKAEKARTRSDALVLGFCALLPELIFTIPLYIIAAIEIMRVGETALTRAGLIVAMTLIAILPLLVINALFATGWNMAEIEKSRVKSKGFVRFLVPMLYILIATIIMVFRIII